MRQEALEQVEGLLRIAHARVGAGRVVPGEDVIRVDGPAEPLARARGPSSAISHSAPR